VARAAWLHALVTRTSYLRVYEPLSCFTRAERERWLRQTEPSSQEPSTAQWLVRGELTSDVTRTEGAFLRRVEDQVYACPWRLRLRMLSGLLEFRGNLPAEVAEAFVPEREAQRAVDELAAMAAHGGSLRSHILHANWHVPIRWFTLFGDIDRVLVEDKAGVRLRYEARLDDAAARARHVAGVLEQASFEDSITELVRRLVEWLEGFDAAGIVELDYGTVARSFSDHDLVDDRAAAELTACVQALEAGDEVEAAQLFAQLIERWGRVRAGEAVN
jgi:hypothetical protein